jgi:hypothetical protein
MPKRQVRYDNPIWDELVGEYEGDPRPYEPGVINLPFTIDDAPFFTGTEFDLPESHTGELIEEKL